MVSFLVDYTINIHSIDIEMSQHFHCIAGIDAALEAIPYEGDNLFVGQVFMSKSDCKIKIAILICVTIDWPWRVYAAKVDGSGNFQIRQATLTHSCSVDARRNYHKLATTQVIGELIQMRFIGIKHGPMPATIRKLMLDDFHVNVSYWKSWRFREIAMETVLGSMAGNYALMHAYMGLLQTINPGSLFPGTEIDIPAASAHRTIQRVALR